jgi:hypothetical protein
MCEEVGVIGYIVVNNLREAVNVESSGCHIGGDEDVNLVVTEALNDTASCSLWHGTLD